MKDIRIIEPRQIIKHEILNPKIELEEKKWGESEWKIEIWKRWKEMERRKIIYLKKENAPKSIDYLRQKISIEIMKEDKEMKIKTLPHLIKIPHER